MRIKCKLNSTDVVGALTDLFILLGPTDFIRSDKRPTSGTFGCLG
jgi:hypothetical protein